MFPFPFSFLGAAADVPLELIDNNFAMEFDGTDQYVNAGSGVDFSASNFSISGWYKVTKSSGNSSMFSMGSSKNIGIWHDGTSVRFNNTTDSSAWSGITATMSKNVWHHVVCVYDGSNKYIYIDGAQASSGSKTGSQQDDGTDQWIGYLAGVSSFAYQGDIDEVAVWNKALALEDVQTIYNATSNNPGKCANLFTGGLKDGLQYWNRMGDN